MYGYNNTNSIFLIDNNNPFVQKVQYEIGSDSHYQISSFEYVEDCFEFLDEQPDVLVMDDISDLHEKVRVKKIIMNESPNTKIIFIGKKLPHNPMLPKEDYVDTENNFTQKLKIAIDEFCFKRDYEEDFVNDVLVIDKAPGRHLDLIIPGIIIIIAVILYIINFT